jgi:sulfite exporter TauE/SafE
MPDALGFLGGFLIGLASSLHCAGLCGNVASTLLFVAAPGGHSGSERARVLMAMQGGRVATYVLLGALAGGVSAAFAGLLQLAGLQAVLRLVAAGALAWSGLAIAGWVPGFVRLDALIAPRVGWWRFSPLARRTSPIVCGMLWGLAPCGMVYGALVNAMLSGSPWQGGVFMAGFGIATIPVVALTAFGIGGIAASAQKCNRGNAYRIAVGSALVSLGVVSIIAPANDISALCAG